MKTRIIFFIYLHLTVAFGETQGERRDCKMHVFVTNLIYHIWCRVCRGFFVLVGNIQLSGFHPTLPMYEWWKLNLDWDPFFPLWSINLLCHDPCEATFNVQGPFLSLACLVSHLVLVCDLQSFQVIVPRTFIRWCLILDSVGFQIRSLMYRWYLVSSMVPLKTLL